MPSTKKRADHVGRTRTVYLTNRKKVLQSQDICAICGRPVDKTIRYPDPLSPSVDHIIPLAKGGHPNDISNLQLTHWICNRMKSDRLIDVEVLQEKNKCNASRIYQSRDWKNF